MEEKRNIRVYKILIGNSEGKKPPGRPRFRCGDNIKIYLKEIFESGAAQTLLRVTSHLPRT
jgi:hypothetical protein